MNNYAIYDSKIGPIYLGYEDDSIICIKTVAANQPDLGQKNTLTDSAFAEIKEYLSGRRQSFSFKYQLKGTPFQQRVWQALLDIPYGQTRSYKQIAEAIDQPKACRAVGMANNKNPLLLKVPCHRVIGSNGKLVGYAAGMDIKEYLLKMEANQL